MHYPDPNNPVMTRGIQSRMDDAYPENHEESSEYDPFVGKVLRKRRQRRGKKPHIQERRRRKDRRRMAKDKAPKYPGLMKKETSAPVKPSPSVSKKPPAPKGSMENPYNNKDLKSHKVMNAAAQNELKTMQEELKTEGLQKKVAQEDLKAEKLKQQAGLMSMSKGIIAVVGVLGAIGLVAYLRRSGKTPDATAMPATTHAGAVMKAA